MRVWLKGFQQSPSEHLSLQGLIRFQESFSQAVRGRGLDIMFHKINPGDRTVSSNPPPKVLF